MNHAILQLADGHVAADGLYTLLEIQQRLNLGRHAMRTARRHGLRVLKIGRSDYVYGADLITYAQQIANGKVSDEGQ